MCLLVPVCTRKHCGGCFSRANSLTCWGCFRAAINSQQNFGESVFSSPLCLTGLNSCIFGKLVSQQIQGCLEAEQDVSAEPDEKPCSVHSKSSEFIGLEREHENKGSSSSKAGDVLWEERMASVPLPRAVYMFFPIVISCEMYNVQAAGIESVSWVHQ